MDQLLSSVMSDLGRAARLVLFRRVERGEPGPGLVPLAVLFGLLLALQASVDAVEAGANSQFNEWGIITALSSLAVFVATLALFSLRASRTVLRRAVADAIAINCLYLVANIAMLAAYRRFGSHLVHAQPLASYVLSGIALLLLIWMLIAVARAGRHLWETPIRWSGTRLLAAFVLPILLIPSQPIVMGSATSWSTLDVWYWSRTALAAFDGQPDQEAPVAPVAYVPPVYDVEDTLFRQQALLNGTLGAIRESDPDKPNFYFLAAAPNGDQDVFASEVTKARDIFDSRFGTHGRSAVLITSPVTRDIIPLATMKNIEVALREIGSVMDRRNDVLVLFITSHGADGWISVSMPGYPLNQITPNGLADALDSAGIKNRVLIISACHSGSFIPRLENPDTLIMTAARADRTSFGCGNGREWTYFGDALFNHALREETDFVKAFDRANALVAQWEFWRRLMQQQPSEPQISVGSEIGSVLKSMQPAIQDQRAEADIEAPQR